MLLRDVGGGVVGSHSTYDAVFVAVEAVLLCCFLMMRERPIRRRDGLVGRRRLLEPANAAARPLPRFGFTIWQIAGHSINAQTASIPYAEVTGKGAEDEADGYRYDPEEIQRHSDAA